MGAGGCMLDLKGVVDTLPPLRLGVVISSVSNGRLRLPVKIFAKPNKRK